MICCSRRVSEQKTPALHQEKCCVPSEEWHIPPRRMLVSTLWSANLPAACGTGEVFAMPGPKTIRALERGLQVLQVLRRSPIASLNEIYQAPGYPSPRC